MLGSMIAANVNPEVSIDLKDSTTRIGECTWQSAIGIDVRKRLFLYVVVLHPAGLVGKAKFLKDDKDFGWVGYTVCVSVSGLIK